MAAPPNAFSSELQKWIYNRSVDSIFFITIGPKASAINALRALMNKVETIPAEKRAAELDLRGQNCTGVVVEEADDHLKILTCAHLMQHVFKSSEPLSLQDACSLFSVRVLCDHYEQSFRGQSRVRARVYAPASMIGIDCEKDLLLLHVYRADIKNLGRRCTNSHQGLILSPTPPEAFDKCAMISWPPGLPRTAVEGSISHPSRTVRDLELVNTVGYTMNLTQVVIASEKGSSGAPLLDGNGRIIGLLHGGFGGQFTYFISHADIGRFLRRHHVVHGI
ncbi:hypothetical protein CFC21_005727 [Triticum aestivum]|uniref:Serine protease n=3 Tax=Triticum TaxID=4564 RepID=A0A9R0V4Q4_TRITD|nr:hypothetical protein CFC21_005727 [Triticum aestivum]VAH14280.1 unnamed protein product [Triticum turgidum subsp. durum]